MGGGGERKGEEERKGEGETKGEGERMGEGERERLRIPDYFLYFTAWQN